MVATALSGKYYWSIQLQWRHNERHGVSNHQSHECLLNRFSMRRSKKTSKLRVTGFVRGIHRWPVNSPQKRPVARKMFPFDDVIMHSLNPEKWGCNFKWVIFKLISRITILSISCVIALMWMPQHLPDHKSAIIQVIACSQTVPSHYLNKCWRIYMVMYAVKRPPWAKVSSNCAESQKSKA